MYKNHVISTQNELLTSGFRVPSRPDHNGADYIDKQDLQITPKGVDILALADGKVVEVINGSLVGWTVAISHEGKILSRYQHMRNNSVTVKVGDTVKKGQRLGVMGNTGSCISSRTDVPPQYRGTHLHFGVKENSTYYNNGVWVDPEPYLRGEKVIPSKPSAPPTPKICDPLGKVLYTDIRTYINGHAIPASVANGKTLVVAEDLKYYGFDVIWDGTAKTLKVERSKSKQFAPLKVDGLPTGVKSGDIKCDYVYTDIKTYLSGEVVESYCIDGKTLIDVELLGKYSSKKWDGDKRELRLTLI